MAVDTNPNIDQHWVLDKRIPLALIAVVFVNIASAVWMASKLDSRITNLEEKEQQRIVRDAKIQDNTGRLVKVETLYTTSKEETNRRLDRLEGGIDRIESKVDSLVDAIQRRFGRGSNDR